MPDDSPAEAREAMKSWGYESDGRGLHDPVASGAASRRVHVEAAARSVRFRRGADLARIRSHPHTTQPLSEPLNRSRWR